MSEAFLARFMCPYSRMGVKSDSLKEGEQLTNRGGGKGRLAWIFFFPVPLQSKPFETLQPWVENSICTDVSLPCPFVLAENMGPQHVCGKQTQPRLNLLERMYFLEIDDKHLP